MTELSQVGTSEHQLQTAGTGRGMWNQCVRLFRELMFAYCSRDVNSSHVLTIVKLLKTMVARDGIEPPTPAFSEPPTELPKWFEINGCH